MGILKQLTVMVAVVLSLQSAEAFAGVMSGQDLIELCEPARADPVHRLKLSECTGYIIGVADTFDCSNKALGFNWDSTKYNDQRKLVSEVLDWLHMHPHVLNYQASGLVASAISGNYPCPSEIADQ